jgi:hypothetical protein
MSVYTSCDEPPEPLLRALGRLVRVVGLTTVHTSDVERGSWLRSWRLREGRSDGLEKLSRLAKKAERAGELRFVYGARAESDEHEANAVATVIRTLDGVDSAVIQLSSMIIVKAHGSVVCRVLTEQEIAKAHGSVVCRVLTEQEIAHRGRASRAAQVAGEPARTPPSLDRRRPRHQRRPRVVRKPASSPGPGRRR